MTSITSINILPPITPIIPIPIQIPIIILPLESHQSTNRLLLHLHTTIIILLIFILIIFVHIYIDVYVGCRLMILMGVRILVWRLLGMYWFEYTWLAVVKFVGFVVYYAVFLLLVWIIILKLY
jgi:hypothetical protein